MSIKQRLEDSREVFNVQIRKQHKKKMLSARRQEIIKQRELQEGPIDNQTPQIQAKLREALNSDDWSQLQECLFAINKHLEMCSSESVQRIASSAIPELVCQVGWISAETCPAGASASKLYFLQILRHLLLEERPPASLENLMGNIVRVVERHIISSSNGEFDEILSILESIVDHKQAKEEMNQYYLVKHVLVRCLAGVQELHPGVASYLNAIIYHCPALLTDDCELIKEIMYAVVRVVLYYSELEDSDYLGHALSVIRNLLNKGVSYPYPTKVFVDLLKMESLDSRDTLKVISIIEELVYQSDDIAVQLVGETVLVLEVLKAMQKSSRDIRAHSVDLLVNLSTIGRLTKTISTILPDIQRHFILEEDERIRSRLFLIVENWAQAIDYQFVGHQIQFIANISAFSAPMSSLSIELRFWLNVNDKAKLNPPNYILDSLSQEQVQHYFGLEHFN